MCSQLASEPRVSTDGTGAKLLSWLKMWRVGHGSSWSRCTARQAFVSMNCFHPLLGEEVAFVPLPEKYRLDMDGWLSTRLGFKHGCDAFGTIHLTVDKDSSLPEPLQRVHDAMGMMVEDVNGVVHPRKPRHVIGRLQGSGKEMALCGQ